MTTEERTVNQEASQANGLNSNATDTNRGNKNAQESENQDNAVDDDCIIGLDVADVWEDEEKDQPRRRSWDRSRGREKRSSREREKERERDHNRGGGRRRSRSRGGRRSRSRGGRRSRSNERRRSRSNERRREPSRRDPSKSSNAIEQDKLRAKKDSDSKILAEKEKAIRTLLDSDNVLLPPGTETEAIQTIVEKNQQEQEIRNQEDRNRDGKGNSTSTSTVRNRLGPKKLSKSPVRGSSPPSSRRDRRSPFSPGRGRRRSNERDTSLDRRIASRRRLREREQRLGRRSRSRGSRDRRRTRSRSFERRRSRSPADRGRRSSRSPFERRLRRSRSRSQERARRRSPFINELARQFSHDGLLPDKQPLIAAPSYSAVPPPPLDPRMGQGILATPGMPGPNMMNPMHPGVVPIMHPDPRMGGPRPGPPPYLGYDGGPAGPPFDPLSRAGPIVDFPAAPVIFANPIMNPAGAVHPMRPVSPVPQPVPAPVVIGQGYPLAGLGAPLQQQQQHQAARSASGSRDKYSPIGASYGGGRYSGSPGDKNYRGKGKREERMKTPEPPIISDVVVKQNEKTSLSSLLEASVSSKDVSSSTASSKGYRPEILRHCERALRSLPTEDPRLKMKGRFFFDPARKEEKKDKPAAGSNSILRRKGRTEIYWDEEQDQMSNGGQPPAPQLALHQQQQPARRAVLTHPKYCQTESPPAREDVGTQAEAEETPKATADFGQQVAPADLMGPPVEDNHRRSLAAMMEESRRASALEEARRPVEENRRPIVEDNNRRAAAAAAAMEQDNRRPVDRLDWSMRETYDHGADRLREKEDLRWSLSNSGGGGAGARPSERLPWSRGFSPKPIDHMHGNAAASGGGVGKQSIMDNYMRAERNDMDLRDRDMDLRMDMRVLEMLRERERLMGTAGLTTRSGGGGGGGGMLDEFTTRRHQQQQQQPVQDDYDMRMNYGGVGSGGGGGPGSVGSFNRAMEMMERERNEQHGGPSPIPEMPDDDDLEIIEERGPWPPITTPAAPAPPQFGNARGGNANRSSLFRGRLGGYRNY